MSFESESRELIRHGQTVTLTMQEATVLETLLRSEGRVLAKSEISALLWPGNQYGEFDLAINNIISKLRRALGEDGREVRCVKTVPKAGYRMICPVIVEEGATPLPLILAKPPLSVPSAAALEPIYIDPVQARAAKRSKRTFLPWVIAALVLLAVVIGGFIFFWNHEKISRQPVKVLGILPFTVIGTESPLAGETLRGELADSIAEIPGVQVRAAHSLTLDMAKDDASLREAAHRLSLDLLLTGTIRLTSNTYECDLELIRGSDSSHLRSFHYEGPRMGLSVVQDQVEDALFALVSSNGGKHHTLRPGDGSNDAARAYDLAFQAAEALTERSAASVDRAINFYQQAIAIDPEYAKAYSGLAESEVVAADLGTGTQVQKHFEAARAAAIHALELNSGNAQAHSALGLILLQNDWQFNQAEKELQEALRLNPGLAANHTKLAILLADRGDFKNAEQEVELAHSLDPLWPVVYGMGLYVHTMGRKYPQAIDDGRAMVAMRPDWNRAHSQLGWAYWYAGQHSEALHEWITAANLAHNTKLASWETSGRAILKKRGVQAYAQAKLRDFSVEGAHDDFVPAEWAAFAGDSNATLVALSQMLDHHDPECLKIAFNPAYDFLRADPRFKQLLQRLNGKIGPNE